ncbi:MAG: hypothetical protein J1E34_05400 [Oscillospiraceae bacterium]|nr:hypothetical protein [Oscillospiraceae bacterium]
MQKIYNTKSIVKRAAACVTAVIMLLCALPINGFALNNIQPLALGDSFEVGDIIEFGSYPQSEVDDEKTLAALNDLTLTWQSYNYYSGNGIYGSMSVGNWMKYADVTYNEKQYRAVMFTEYRPNNTQYALSINQTYQDDNGYMTDTIYWFRYEPIKWRVLDPEAGLVVSESLIDAQPYNNTIYYANSEYWKDSEYTVYANDYEHSTIREWLNKDFYNTAFTESQQELIAVTTCENGASADDSQYSCGNTQDKVFLPSYSDLANTDYGFSSKTDAWTSDPARTAFGSDYAKCQGLRELYNNNSWWLLRSPSCYSSGSPCAVNYEGALSDYYYQTYQTFGGIRPALVLNEDFVFCKTHTYDEPEWIWDGYDSVSATFTCLVCGESTTENGNIANAVTKAVRCTEDGEITYTAQVTVYENVYTDVKTEVIAAHHIDNGSNTKIYPANDPTCTENGYTEGVYCYDCQKWVSGHETIAARHIDDDNNGICDSCGNVLTKCTHICHNNNLFINFFYKIVRFFWKLFGINKYCACGYKHY